MSAQFTGWLRRWRHLFGLLAVVTGVLGLIISVVLIAAGFALWNSDTAQCVRNSDNQAQVQACADEVQNQVDNTSN